ncbi:MAG: prepilin-type N-terminal cleavage/methylation domain-containing protein [Bdellovibrionales bacterium]|nr:prepilin-type N-terminal cleavage/methylation domain-containing protein [Bdellovibrionales bacterium]
MHKRGFSLMELVTATAIIVILSSVAYVSWRKYIRTAIMSEAKVSLSMVFASQYQYKATCNTYHPDLRTVGALPKGKLYYNVGGNPSTGVTDWGHCLTEEDATCTGCVTYFDEICCSQSDFEDTNNDCPCYIRDQYKIDKSTVTGSGHTSAAYCGADFTNGSILTNKFCVLAATAINKKRGSADSAEWDVWAVNHLNIVKQVHSPGN